MKMDTHRLRHIFATALLAALLLPNVVLVQTAHAMISISNHAAKANPCNSDEMPNDVYKDFLDILSQVLGTKAGVVRAINMQIDRRLKEGGFSPKKIDVEVFVVTLDEFKKEYSADRVGEKEALIREAAGLFEKYVAYTYETKDHKIKIKVFCKPALRTETIDNERTHDVFRLIIHELVHAKLDAMLLSGMPEENLPFNDKNDETVPKEHPADHNAKFSMEVDKLLKDLLSNLAK